MLFHILHHHRRYHRKTAGLITSAVFVLCRVHAFARQRINVNTSLVFKRSSFRVGLRTCCSLAWLTHGRILRGATKLNGGAMQGKMQCSVNQIPAQTIKITTAPPPWVQSHWSTRRLDCTVF